MPKKTDGGAPKQSRYAKKGASYQYSAHLRAWERAIRTGNGPEADAAARAHQRQFGYQRGRAVAETIAG